MRFRLTALVFGTAYSADAIIEGRVFIGRSRGARFACIVEIPPGMYLGDAV